MPTTGYEPVDAVHAIDVEQSHEALEIRSHFVEVAHRGHGFLCVLSFWDPMAEEVAVVLGRPEVVNVVVPFGDDRLCLGEELLSEFASAGSASAVIAPKAFSISWPTPSWVYRSCRRPTRYW